MRKSLFFGITLAAVAVVSTPLMSAALPDIGTTVEAVSGRVKDARTDLDMARRLEETQARREAIEQKIADKKAAIEQKLSGKRAEVCEKKQEAINRVLDTRVDAAQKHLDKLNAIRDKLAIFVTDKQLTVENTSALEVIMNDKQTAAQAAVDAAKSTDFDCTEADASAPGKIVTEQVTAQKEALKEYRDAIKEYALAVRTAATTETETEVTQ